ncbi:NUDIX hydrolase [Sphingobium algorifonticola]|uniref:NUDIX hydrolase n=1 Tax=Sphingobium algorifonticola TaxID=2008318 RepID=A0A437J8K3_9SPHN|nr:NUDIX domain-containing protein [Sphingobium algorifonticola]RVT41818.1 NUDIX hydrolase [Sphingobium algorifonticola]
MTAAPSSPPSRDAATLIVLRDGVEGQDADGAPQILMVQRAETMAFAAGALVFPGGAVDADDHRLAAQWHGGLPVVEAAVRIAAIRETLEEAGVAPGLIGAGPAMLAAMRANLQAGAAFSALVQDAGLTLDLSALTPFARWHPIAGASVRRIFDARFYIARHDPAAGVASVDATEHVALFWASARAVLDRCVSGGHHILYPTRRNLERLAQFTSIAAILDHARALPVEKIVPWVEERADGAYLCIPGHLGYPVTAEPIESAMRS